jgi:hypothetical protein
VSVLPPKLTHLESQLLHALQLYTREQEFEVRIARSKQAIMERKRKRERKK